MTPLFTVEDARELARVAHHGQSDKLGEPYFTHVNAVGSGLVDFDDDIQIAGFLHDIVEDTEHTLESLRELGVSDRALNAVEHVSRNLHPELSYSEAIAHVAKSPDAALVKISDNAHNSDPDRVQRLIKATGKSPPTRYADSRPALFAAVATEDAERILQRVNPSLLSELDGR